MSLFFFLFIRFTVWILFFFGVPSNFKRVSILNFPEENGLLRLVCHIVLCHCRVFAAQKKQQQREFWISVSNEKQWKDFSKVNAALVYIETLVEKQMELHDKAIQNGLKERRKKRISVCDSCTHDTRISSSTKCTRLTRALVHWRIEQTDKRKSTMHVKGTRFECFIFNGRKRKKRKRSNKTRKNTQTNIKSASL